MPQALRITWADNRLAISGPHLPGGTVEVMYLEAFCRAGAHARDWGETLIPHRTRLLDASADGTSLQLETLLADGCRITHAITARADVVAFQLAAHNPTSRESQAHWAQPCIQVGHFTGCAGTPDPEAYITNCFVFLDGRLTRMPTASWAEAARYTPGQVWCPPHVPRADVNPRPLNPQVPDCGLIGCFSQDQRLILATAWEPCHELFQGILQCIHADFRMAGLRPGTTRHIRGRIYIVPADPDALLARYRLDFPEQVAWTVNPPGDDARPSGPGTRSGTL